MRRLFLFLFTMMFVVARSQDIEAVIKAPVLNISGGVSANGILTLVPGDSLAMKNPFAYSLSGNLNFSLFGVVNMPLSFTYSNQRFDKNFSLPFNRFALSPSYKWIKVYAGYTSMSFSPYTLAGHELLGGGVELTPDNGFKFSALFGRMKKASDSIAEGMELSYTRLGGGFKAEYQKEKFGAGINIFKAQDLKNSLKFENTDSLSVLPQDNLTGGANFSLNVINGFRLSAEYGFSAINKNISEQSDKFGFLKTKGDLSVYHAAKAQAAYSHRIGSLGATYEYVAPNYTTLGAYYMTNDFQNITANLSTNIKKIALAFDAGYQTNNLDKQKDNTSSRFIYSGNASGSFFADKFNFAISFSNLQSYMYINDVYSQVTQTNPYENLDTLNVTQLNYTASANIGYAIVNTKEQRQNINANFMFQRSSENQQYSELAGNNIYNASLSYQFSLNPAQFNASATVSYNHTEMPQKAYSQAITYSLMLSKNFFKELKTSFAATYSDMNSEKGAVSDVFNLRLNAGYTLAKKHNFNFATTFLFTVNNVAAGDGTGTAPQVVKQKRTQYVINISYAYSFGMTLTREEKKL
ncbi:MAG: outer membrane beta-barrel family protein, partial [Bacteroidales bacterium]|nr:outer membrane beta-barrel family protein [Bacteroidales bacterium]